MCNMLVRLLACVVFAGAGISAHPTLKDSDKIKEGSDSNKTNTITDQRAASHPADKSAGPILVPVYQQFLPSPMNMPPSIRFQRVIVPPQIPAYPVRNPVSFVNRQPVRLTSSYSPGYQTHPQVSIPQQEMFVQPMTPPTNSLFPPQQIYQQPVVLPPSSYNFAPYASNSYAMYTSRSAVDDDQKFASLALDEQPQYSSAGGYILNPQRIEYRVEQQPSTMYVSDYSSIPNPAYSSEGMEPRHVKISSMDSSHEDLSHMSFVEPSDQVFYEVIDPSMASQLEQQPHIHNMNFRVIGEQQLARHSTAKPYVNLESMNWMWSRGDYPAVYM